jgi:hypothetical protein
MNWRGHAVETARFALGLPIGIGPARSVSCSSDL